MQPGKAFVGGVLGAAAMTFCMGLLRALGAPLNLELLLGSAITSHTGLATWILGFLVHLAIGGLFGLAYGLAFERVTHVADAPTGMLLAVAHLVVAGPAVALLGSIHPLVPDTLEAPGPFYAGMGSFSLAEFLLMHLIFGGIVGAVYRPVRVEHRRRLPTRAAEV